MIVADSCSIILLAKSTILERASEIYKINITEDVLKEVIKGKDKMFIDALITERLIKENKLNIISYNKNIAKKLLGDFNMGIGEASTIAAALKQKCIIATDNKQGRKVATINNLNIVGSPDIIVSLWKKKKVSKEKAFESLEILKREGWYNNYIIEKALEDLK